jgi:hypothetical protein
MNERQAEQEGLEFTGIYNFDKEDTIDRIVKERKEKPRARVVLVRVPHSHLSRGGAGVGWAAYADKYFKAYNLLQDFSKRMENHPTHVLSVLNKHDQERKELEAKFREYTKIVEEAKETLAS